MKKWLAALLAVLLMMLPLSGLAESPDELMEKALDAGLTLETQITLIPGNLPFGEAYNEPLSDMLSALSLYRLSAREGRNAFAVQLSGEDAFRVDWEDTPDRFYFSSNWLGGEVISFNDEEAGAALARLAELMGGAMNVTLEELEEALSVLGTAQPELAEEDLAEIAEYLQTVLDRVEVSEVTQQPRNCDPAQQMFTLTLTAEDIAQYYEIVFDMLLNNQEFMSMLQAMNASASLNGESMTVEEGMKEFPELIRSKADQIGEIPVTVYLDSNGNPVKITAGMRITSDAGQAVSMDLDISRQTTTDGIGWAANLEMAENDVPLAGLTVSYLADSRTMDVFTLAVVAKQEGADDVEMLSISYLANKEYAANDAKHSATLAFSFRPDVDQEPLALTLQSNTEALFDGTSASLNSVAELYLTGEEAPILTKTRTVANVEAPASLTETEAVTPGTMDDMEFQLFLNQALANLTAGATKALQLLPESVLQILLPVLSMM